MVKTYLIEIREYIRVFPRLVIGGDPRVPFWLQTFIPEDKPKEGKIYRGNLEMASCFGLDLWDKRWASHGGKENEPFTRGRGSWKLRGRRIFSLRIFSLVVSGLYRGHTCVSLL